MVRLSDCDSYDLDDSRAGLIGDSMTQNNDEHDDHSERINRRSVIKKGVVGAAAAGVVWSAPKVEGLSLRPNYAAAQTGGVGSTTGTVTVQFNSEGGTGLTRQDNTVCPDFSIAVDVVQRSSNKFSVKGDWAFSPGGGTVNQMTIDAATGSTTVVPYTDNSDSDMVNAGSLGDADAQLNLGSANPKLLTVTVDCT